jgi:hypothetical protein
MPLQHTCLAYYDIILRSLYDPAALTIAPLYNTNPSRQARFLPKTKVVHTYVLHEVSDKVLGQQRPSDGIGCIKHNTDKTSNARTNHSDYAM